MLAQIKSATLTGLTVHNIKVEIDASRGLPSWDIVGLPDTAVKESKERVHTAIKNSGFDFPPRRIVVNLAPANLKKEGPIFDLPIAIAILMATEQIPYEIAERYVFIGELGLDGALHRVNGILPISLSFAEEGSTISLVTSQLNADEAALSGIETYGFKNLSDVVSFLKSPELISPTPIPDINSILKECIITATDFADIKGQREAKRALEIAAAGNHNVILIGSPGSGKTMLARALPGIMPPMTREESLETSKIHSIAGLLSASNYLVTERPFRSPHHTSSQASLIGGGRIPKPGEVSLAHHGVLFMDEFPEYKREVLEALRQPLEDGIVTVSRVTAQLTYPCDFLLLAAMNPCPCGHLNDPNHTCTCTPAQVSRYHHRISGPLLDRFDIQLEVTPVEFLDLYKNTKEESSETILQRVTKARDIQTERFRDCDIFANSGMSHKQIREYCSLNDDSKKLLKRAFDSLGLSARAHDRILKLARTIADLAGSENIEPPHIAEAIQYRALDKKMWNVY